MRISDWSSDVCSSDLSRPRAPVDNFSHLTPVQSADCRKQSHPPQFRSIAHPQAIGSQSRPQQPGLARCWTCRKSASDRSEEHTSELQSLMRTSYAVFCLKKKTHSKTQHTKNNTR